MNKNANIVDLSTYDLASVKREIDVYQKKLQDLRKDGSTKALVLEEEISSIKNDKLISKEEKKSKIEVLKSEVKKAKEVRLNYKEEEKNIISEAKKYLNDNLKPYYYAKKSEAKTLKVEENELYKQKVTEENENFNKLILEEKSVTNDLVKEEKDRRLSNLRRSHSAKLFELKLNHKKRLADIKTEVHEIYLDIVRYLNNFND